MGKVLRMGRTLTQREAKRAVFTMLDCEKPVIAKVNGDAVGLGATLALFSDITVISETARFGDPHVKVGLVAGDGGSVVWPLLGGPSRAKDFLLRGRLVTGGPPVGDHLAGRSSPLQGRDPAHVHGVRRARGRDLRGHREAARGEDAFEAAPRALRPDGGLRGHSPRQGPRGT